MKVKIAPNRRCSYEDSLLEQELDKVYEARSLGYQPEGGEYLDVPELSKCLLEREAAKGVKGYIFPIRHFVVLGVATRNHNRFDPK
ncbi:MAG: hypothetical protein QNJ72_18215 [Pleurocapsa sp. MO_226.B13]|nr:hypothetical protein [Pleurocapsa sp. MO_226.B13]